MAEIILNVPVKPTLPTSDGLFYNHSNQPIPSANLQSMVQAAGLNVDSELLKGMFALYMGQYHPFVSNDIYTADASDNPANPGQVASAPLSGYYNGLFLQALKIFAGQYSQTNQLGSTNAAVKTQHLGAFATYMATSPQAQDTRFRQQNVQFWQFTYLLTLMFKLQNTAAIQATDPVKYEDAMIVAQKKSQGVTNPQLQFASGTQVPDPSLVQKQGQAQIALEKYRQSFNVSSDRSRQSQTNLSFTQDAIHQNNSANNNFWQSMKKLLRAVQNL